MSSRVFCSVKVPGGIIELNVLGRPLQLSRQEACKLLTNLAWAVETSADEVRLAEETEAAKRELAKKYAEKFLRF